MMSEEKPVLKEGDVVVFMSDGSSTIWKIEAIEYGAYHTVCLDSHNELNNTPGWKPGEQAIWGLLDGYQHIFTNNNACLHCTTAVYDSGWTRYTYCKSCDIKLPA